MQEHTLENKNKAVSFAAYATLVDLFPSRQEDFALQMKELGYSVDGSDTSTPAKIGATAAHAVIQYRHKDGANQLGGYADTTGYQPVNTPDQVNDRWRWQPLRVPLGSPTGKVQKALTPQWAEVVPFGMTSPGTPARDVTLSWPTFSSAAGEAGMSRRYGGIHFASGDLHARDLGSAVGWDAWWKAQSYI